MKLPLNLFAVVVLTASFMISLNGGNKVSVRAEATQEYVKARASDESKKIQTYQFMKGRYFPGDVRRVTMENFTFMELLESLAVQLQRQNYYPDPENGEGDLVIVVHYGVTFHPSDFLEDFGYTSLSEMGFQDVEDMEFGLHAQEWMNNSQAKSKHTKAMLLGMEEAYDWKREFSDNELQLMVEQARFFVILIAYDLPLAKKGIIQAHWMTRFSIRAAGQSYDQAVFTMNDVAGDYFGKNLEGLQKRFSDDDSRVEFGEIEVIEEKKQ